MDCNSDHPNLRLIVKAQVIGDYIKYTVEDNGRGSQECGFVSFTKPDKPQKCWTSVLPVNESIFSMGSKLPEMK
jgi:hypothetical protein